MPENLTAEKHKTITIKRTFNLPLSAVWKAWTEPESMKKWWGPKEYTCPDCSIDFRVGGKFLASLKKIVNTDSFADSTGTIVPASYYKMSGDWGLELLVTTEFEEVDGKTNISLQHAGLPVELSDECMQGWQSSFDKLKSNMK